MLRRFTAYSLTLTFILVACGADPTPLPTVSAPPVVKITPGVPPTATQPLAPAATAAPTSTPAVLMGPDSYPAGINPLTGLSITPALQARVPVAIKIANYPRVARPQSGLSLADLVVEHYTEGGTTRFTAVFYGTDAPRVGPIRSARLIDTVIPEMFKGALVTSGSSMGVLRKLSFKDWYKLVIAESTGFKCPPICREGDDTNSVYTSTETVHKALADKGLDKAQLTHGFAFHAITPAGGAPAKQLRIDYSGELHTEWRYNAVSAKYERWIDTSPTDLIAHFDKATNQPITANNVIVLFINHVVDSTIPEDFDTDGLTGHFSTEIQLWGSGPAWIFRDGQRYEGTWVRPKIDQPFVIVDKANKVIPLKPGNSWIQIVGLFSDKTAGSDIIIKHKSPVDKGNIPTAVPSATPKP